MAKTFSIILGVIYVLLGLVGFLNTSLVGQNGLFAANEMYDVAFIVVGAVLLIGAMVAAQATRTINIVVGVVLALAAVTAFSLVPDRGVLMGMLVSYSDSWLNLVAAVLLVGSSLAARDTSHSSLRGVRHAM